MGADAAVADGMRPPLLVTGPVLALASACLGSVLGETASTSSQTLTVPAPFALQFVATYVDPHAPAGAVRSLELHRDGSYAALVTGQPASGVGAFVASAPHQLPLSIDPAMDAGWSATITAYDGQLRALYDGHPSTLRAAAPVGPVETLCEATGGAWLDDDVDDATGLYCHCRSPNVYIPSAGGCVP